MTKLSGCWRVLNYLRGLEMWVHLSEPTTLLLSQCLFLFVVGLPRRHWLPRHAHPCRASRSVLLFTGWERWRSCLSRGPKRRILPELQGQGRALAHGGRPCVTAGAEVTVNDKVDLGPSMMDALLELANWQLRPSTTPNGPRWRTSAHCRAPIPLLLHRGTCVCASRAATPIEDPS
jgi:hypothetical protein